MAVRYGWNPILEQWVVLSEIMNGYPFASNAETLAGTVDVKAVTPASLASTKNAVYDALALKAPLASPTFTGNVIVPDQTAGNNSTKAANTKYVDAGLGLKADLTYAEYLMMEGDPA